MCWSPKLAPAVYNSRAYKSTRQAVHGLSGGFTRVWTLVIYACSLGLGLAVIFSCYSTKTSEIHLYRIYTQPFIQDYLTSNNNADNALLQAQINATNPAKLALMPDTYYFGVSGICSHSNTTGLTCEHSFPVNYNIPAVIFGDLARVANITLPSNFSSDTSASVIDSMSKATSALLIVTMVWILACTVLVFIWPDHIFQTALPLLMLALLSLAAWLTGNAIWLKEGNMYNLGGQSNVHAGQLFPKAFDLGPGSGIWVGFVVCTLALTPVMAFWSLVTIIILVLLVVLIAIEVCLLILAVMAACACSGQSTTTTYYGDNSGINLGGN